MPDQPNLAQPPTFPDTADIPPAPQEASEPINIPPIITSSNTPKKRSEKLIATILGIFLLVGAIGAGVVLVGQKQDIREKAVGQCPVINGCVADHEESECNDSGEMCTVYIGEPGYESNSTVCSVAGTQCGTSGYYCMIFGSCHACIKYTTCYWKATNCVADVSCGTPTYTPTPEPTPQPENCGRCSNLPESQGCWVTWTDLNGGCDSDFYNNRYEKCPDSRCTGTPTPTPTGTLRVCNASCQADEQCSTGYCTNAGVCRNPSCPSDTDCICTGTPTPTPTPTPRVTPTPTPGSAMCMAVKAYDTNWNLLTGVQLSALSAGSVIRFTISGIPADQIDKARFTINGVLGPETINKKPGTNEYYVEYTIPAGVYSFTITAQIHHLTLGWF